LDSASLQRKIGEQGLINIFYNRAHIGNCSLNCEISASKIRSLVTVRQLIFIKNTIQQYGNKVHFEGIVVIYLPRVLLFRPRVMTLKGRKSIEYLVNKYNAC